MSYEPVTYDFEILKKKLLSSPAAVQEYENLEEEFILIRELIHARKRAHKTQQDVAKTMHTTSSVVSRLESIAGQDRHSPKVETLRRYAKAVGCKLLIKLVPEAQYERHVA
jgi:DNA-binding XRE family transcriptional regulator